MRNVPLADLARTLESTDLRWALAVVALQLVFIAIKAWRWGLLLKFVPGVRFREMHSAVYAGLAVNYLVAHVGELLRSVSVARKRSASVSAVLASIFVERALDFVALLLLLGIAASFSTEIPEMFTAMLLATFIIIVVAIVGLHMILDTPHWLARWSQRLASPLPKRLVSWVSEQIDRSRQGLASLKDYRLMTLVVLVSVVQWMFVVLLMWASTYAVGEPGTFLAATITFLLVVLGQQIPNAPLQVGTTQLAFALGFGTAGVSATGAVAASVIFMSFAIVPTMLIGGVCILTDQVSDLRQLT